MMTVNTTTHPGSTDCEHRYRCQLAEPGYGYRLLQPGEMLLATDDVWTRLSLTAPWVWVRNNSHTGRLLLTHWRPRRRRTGAERPTDELYKELLFAVARAYPGETRHETALRYIREREDRTNIGECGQAASDRLAEVGR
jgi:hypothetical protein